MANKHGNKRIICWPPFWNKVYDNNEDVHWGFLLIILFQGTLRFVFTSLSIMCSIAILGRFFSYSVQIRNVIFRLLLAPQKYIIWKLSLKCYCDENTLSLILPDTKRTSPKQQLCQILSQNSKEKSDKYDCNFVLKASAITRIRKVRV